ncbi:uncharacterized protein LOC123296267 [Chrysoperla carnea]|uniref:uncharacterized protein LOC123296267 n=1 Tax=Chrysoperla carnea TaxID=189513 RepID=UPI001D094043|nr:uncharacterized protein LOC123296267 [Chrysoperla carnea]
MVNLLNSISCFQNYQKRTLEDDSFCSLLVKRKTSLSDDADEGLIVTSNRLKEHSTDWNYDHACKFQIRIGRDFTDLLTLQKPSNIGLIAVIQKLSLRQNKTTGECIDWIQFGHKKNINSKRYCGELSYDNESGNMFYFPVDTFTDKIDTTVFINRKRLESDEYFDLLIVYTPIIMCRDAYSSYLKCSKDDDIKAICIRNVFKNDSYLNCPNCLDEGDSCRIKTKHSSGVGTVATIGAILSLIISFIFFLSCVWICKRFNLFCWSHTFAAGTNRSTQHSNVEMNLQGSTPTPNIPTVPSAPPVSADKDLPPPYESLFPERAGDR